MILIISGRGITISDRLKADLQKKFDKMDKYFNPGTSATIALSKEGDMAKIEANIETKLGHINAVESSKDLDKAVDAACESIKNQMKKYKDKIVDKKHSATSFGKTIAEEDTEEEEE